MSMLKLIHLLKVTGKFFDLLKPKSYLSRLDDIIWFYHVSTKVLFLKIAVPKKQAKSLKSTCEVVSFCYICKLYT